MGTVSTNFLPSASGLDLGATGQRWDAIVQTIDCSGAATFSSTVAITGALTLSGAMTLPSPLTSTVITGTAPFVVASATKVTNLNADLLDGTDWTAPGTIGGTTPGAANFTTISASGVITSTRATGTAPFTVASTTNVANLNCSSLLGSTWAIPAAIGSTTPAAGTFTTLTGNTSLTVNGGTAITKVVVYSPSLTPSSVNLTTADKVVVNPPAIANATGIAGARVSAADTLAIRFNNPTGGALTPTAGTYTVIAFRS
jgi:hypothetical protein